MIQNSCFTDAVSAFNTFHGKYVQYNQKNSPEGNDERANQMTETAEAARKAFSQYRECVKDGFKATRLQNGIVLRLEKKVTEYLRYAGRQEAYILDKINEGISQYADFIEERRHFLTKQDHLDRLNILKEIKTQVTSSTYGEYNTEKTRAAIQKLDDLINECEEILKVLKEKMIITPKFVLPLRNDELFVEFELRFEIRGHRDFDHSTTLKELMPIEQAKKMLAAHPSTKEAVEKIEHINPKKKTLIEEANRPTIVLEGNKYMKDNPCATYLCELKAQEQGKEFVPPTTDEFLDHVAECLVKFEDPYKDFEIRSCDEQRIDYNLMGNFILIGENRVVQLCNALEELLTKKASPEKVKLTTESPPNIEDYIFPSFAKDNVGIYFKLTIGDQNPRYFIYSQGKFGFLVPKK